METNHARNKMLRDAFKVDTPTTKDDVEKKLSSPYVPTARDYPSAKATKESMAHARSTARVQVAFDTIWRHYGSWIPDWAETFNLLKRMTAKRSETSNMAAVRIVLPKSWDLEVGSRKVEILDSTTGLISKLRLSGDHQNPSAIVLRGKSSVLAKAADELVAACKDVEVFKLGNVDTFGYEEKRLWPALEDVPDSDSTLPDDNIDNIWVHKEHQNYWIEKPYEQTHKPKEWTKESFASYVTTLVCGRLRPHLALRYYRQPRKDGKFIDTDGIRVRLIVQAFMDPLAKASITPSILKMAMAFMAHKGGHRASADRLLTKAEEWGMPLDTDMFNVMLEGYVTKRDVVFFHKFLLKMESRYFHPNARTWLLFLELVQREDERRQIIVAMYDLGFFEDSATRRGIARIMAAHDAYIAFRGGKKLEVFMAEQTMRYGQDWFTAGTLNCILKEFFRFHGEGNRRFDDFKSLIQRQSEDGRMVDISAINLVLEHAVSTLDWDTAFWALTRLPLYKCEADERTYQLIIRLAVNAKCPSALGVAFFYGVIDRGLRESARKTMRLIFLGLHHNPFWRDIQPKVFSKKMGKELEAIKVLRGSNAVAGAEWAILSKCDGYKPTKSLAAALEVAYRTMDRPMHQQRKDARREHKDFQVGEYIVKLRYRGPDGEPDNMLVRLDGRFRPERMIREWDPTRTIKSETPTTPEEPKPTEEPSPS